MLVADYDIVFQEVPDETTLALNISDCPHHCPGCHSSYLWQPVGDVLTPEWLQLLIERYPYITCVSIQGGDRDYHEVERVAQWVHMQGKKIKVGPYIEALGGLKSKTTNQRFYRVTPEGLRDITDVFWK